MIESASTDDGGPGSDESRTADANGPGVGPGPGVGAPGRPVPAAPARSAGGTSDARATTRVRGDDAGAGAVRGADEGDDRSIDDRGGVIADRGRAWTTRDAARDGISVGEGRDRRRWYLAGRPWVETGASRWWTTTTRRGGDDR